MALTVDNKVRTLGSRRVVFADVDFDSSYPTGGESLTPGDLGLGSIDFLIASPTSGYTFQYDYTNKTLLAYQGDNANAAAAPSVQVPNTTNLSAVTNVRILAAGR